MKKIFAVLIITVLICSLSLDCVNAAASYNVIWLSPSITQIEDFNNGYATVFQKTSDYESFMNMIGGNYGCIDKNGKLVVPLKYKRGAEYLSNELAIVAQDPSKGKVQGYYQRFGFYDIKAGKEILPPVYDCVWNSDDGIIMLKQYDTYSQLGAGRYGYIDQKGNVILPVEYDSGTIFKDGYAFIKKDKKWYVIDTTGKFVKNLPYEQLKGNSDGLITVMNNGKYGFIDSSGNEIIPPTYDSIEQEFKEGIAIVKQNDRYIIIDKSGKQLFDSISDEINYIGGGYFQEKKDGKFAVVDKSGRRLTEYIYEYCSFRENNLILVEKRDSKSGSIKRGCINSEGKQVIPTIYDDMGSFVEGMSQVRKGNEKFFIDKSGKQYKYPYIIDTNFKNGLVIAEKSSSKYSKYGIINKAGKVIVPFVYDAASITNVNGLYWVGKYDTKVKIGYTHPLKIAFMNSSGRLSTPFIYSSTYEFSEGLCVVQKNGKWGYIDANGKEVIPCIYDAARSLKDGAAEVKLKNRWGLIKYPFKTSAK